MIGSTTTEVHDQSTNSESSQDDKVNNNPNEEMENDDTALNYDFALREVISNELNNGMLSFAVKSYQFHYFRTKQYSSAYREVSGAS